MRFISPILFIFALTFFSTEGNGQYQIELSTQSAISEEFTYLLWSNQKISSNDTINESIVDLVSPTVSDSIIKRKIQHHKLGPVGWFISTFAGYNWRAASLKKEKFVGTVTRHSRSGEEQFTEYDINYDIIFHLKKYLYRIFYAFDLQRKYKKQDFRPSHRRDFSKSPYVRDSSQINNRDYKLHCELTPTKVFRDPLNHLFYPTIPGGGGPKEHPNILNEFPTFGFYGVFCSDCNHSCHPEIHPYEWIWWLKNNDQDTGQTKEWYFGLFHEASNRMKKWSSNPKIGEVKIPFVFQLGGDKNMNLIEISPLLMGQLNLKVDKPLAFMATATNSTFQINYNGKAVSNLTVKFSPSIHFQAFSYDFQALNYDPQKNVLSGFLHIKIQVKDLFAFKVKYQPV